MDLKNLNVSKIKRIIFDLDDTLFDTFNQLVTPAAHEACAAMVGAGLNATVDQTVKAREGFINTHKRFEVFEKIVQHFGVKGSKNSSEVARIGFEAFHNREIKEPISLFPCVPELLESLNSKYELFLVTLGGLQTQQRKVELLNLQSYFKDIHYVDKSKEKNKRMALKKILSKPPFVSPGSHLSVGNRIDSEIRDAKELGMQTLLIVHGEHRHLVAESPSEIPDLQISELERLVEIFK